MRFKHKLRHGLHRIGLDVVRYPLHDPVARTVKLIEHYQVDLVIDVGANDGGFGSSIRDLGYRGQIVSFEPLSSPFSHLHRRATADANWTAHQCAVGNDTADVTINVSGNDGLSSSILPMLESHTNAAPDSRYVGVETVRQECLDNLVSARDCSEARIFLKIDVQGYEGAVLDGATRLLASGAVVGLQLELSLVDLYKGGMTYLSAIDRAKSLGMELMGLDPVFADSDSGRLLQADGVFFLADDETHHGPVPKN